jgi:hypothetical protein
MKMILLILFATLLAGCVHEAVVQPTGPGGAVLYSTKTGLVFGTEGHLLWLREGVPSDFFTNVGPERWYISNVNWHQGNQIRLKAAQLK